MIPTLRSNWSCVLQSVSCLVSSHISPWIELEGTDLRWTGIQLHSRGLTALLQLARSGCIEDGAQHTSASIADVNIRRSGNEEDDPGTDTVHERSLRSSWTMAQSLAIAGRGTVVSLRKNQVTARSIELSASGDPRSSYLSNPSLVPDPVDDND
nr:hypothetical protein CFP56_76449 [Quercus suber]